MAGTRNNATTKKGSHAQIAKRDSSLVAGVSYSAAAAKKSRSEEFLKNNERTHQDQMEKEDTTNNKTKNHHVVINIVPPSNAQCAAGKHASDTASSSLSCSSSDASGSLRKNNLVRLQNNLLDEDEEEDHVGSSGPTSVDQSGKSLTSKDYIDWRTSKGSIVTIDKEQRGVITFVCENLFSKVKFITSDGELDYIGKQQGCCAVVITVSLNS